MKNFDYNHDFSNYSDDELNSIQTELCEEHSLLVSYTAQKIKSLVLQYMDGWEVLNLYNDRLVLGVKDSSRNLNVDIYFGYEWWKENKSEFEFKINPSSLGSFDILGDSEEKTYYVGIGIILSHPNFQRNLYDFLKAFHPDITVLRTDIHIVSSEIKKRERKVKEEQERNDMLAAFANTANEIKKYQELTKTSDIDVNLFVVYNECPANHLANATYRNKPIQILPVGVVSLNEARDIIRKNSQQFLKNKHVKAIKLCI